MNMDIIPATPAAVKVTRDELAQLPADARRAFMLWCADRAVTVCPDTATWTALRIILRDASARRPHWVQLTAAANDAQPHVPSPPTLAAVQAPAYLAAYYAQQTVYAAVYEVVDGLQAETTADYAVWAAALANGGTVATQDAARRAERTAQRQEWARLLMMGAVPTMTGRYALAVAGLGEVA